MNKEKLKTYFSKLRYCSCIQCPKILCLKEHLLEEFDYSVINQIILSIGNKVGDFAIRLFGEFSEVPFTENIGDMIPSTQKLIDEGVQNICKASFSYDSCFFSGFPHHFAPSMGTAPFASSLSCNMESTIRAL